MADLDPDGCLRTAGGRKLPPLAMNAEKFIDKSIAIYGASGTGKTVIAKSIMRVLKPHIDQVLVVSPTEPSNRQYADFVAAPFIHYRVYQADPANPRKDDGAKGTLRFLMTILQRQEMMAAIYKRANNPEVLAQLFGRLSREARMEGHEVIEKINAKRSRVIARVTEKYASTEGLLVEKIREVNDQFKRLLVLIYKKHITPEYESLWRGDLSEEERYSLNYLWFNPRLLLIFDDCAAELKPFMSKEWFRKLFYQGRHVFITLIILAQDDTDLLANLRKNAFISFFTDPVVCVSNFERAANQFPRSTRFAVAGMVPDVFKGDRKFAYIREDSTRQHFYHVMVPYPTPFKFGSKASLELCESVQSDGVVMDKENPFYDRFKLE